MYFYVFLLYLFVNLVGVMMEFLGRDGKVVGFVLESIEMFVMLGDFVDVIVYYFDGVVDLL